MVIGMDMDMTGADESLAVLRRLEAVNVLMV